MNPAVRWRQQTSRDRRPFLVGARSPAASLGQRGGWGAASSRAGVQEAVENAGRRPGAGWHRVWLPAPPAAPAGGERPPTGLDGNPTGGRWEVSLKREHPLSGGEALLAAVWTMGRRRALGWPPPAAPATLRWPGPGGALGRPTISAYQLREKCPATGALARWRTWRSCEPPRGNEGANRGIDQTRPQAGRGGGAGRTPGKAQCIYFKAAYERRGCTRERTNQAERRWRRQRHRYGR